jgi:threonylcarbamoyladenosine tRNA methylthiotransferase MtaB
MEHRLEGRRVRIVTLGCRTNLSEGESLASAVEADGARLVDDASWDAAVLVSCSVTAEADRKCRQVVRRLRRERPDGIVVACGCWAQAIDEGRAAELGVDIVVGNRRKGEIPGLLAGCLPGRPFRPVTLRGDVRNDRHWDDLPLRAPSLHTRAFLKVQDGCDHFCSYCVIPYLRGRSVSRPLAGVIEDVRSVVAAGCREIVLSGIHLGDYRDVDGTRLGGLVSRVASLEGVKRIRFGSLEPFSLDETLLSVLAATETFCRHLHLPLQSGDDRVLARMRRGHTAGAFLKLVGRVRNMLGEDIHISTDVLVGFPGETDEAFDNTLRVLDEAGIARTHVFPFSPRAGTPAAAFSDRVPEGTVASRVSIVRGRSEERLAAYARRFVGRIVPILAERSDGTSVEGLTPEYLRVEASGTARSGSIVPVLVTGTGDEIVRGEVFLP